MKPWILAGIAIAAFGTASAAFAQDVIAQRRDGLRAMGRHMEAIKAVSDARGDTRPLVARAAPADVAAAAAPGLALLAGPPLARRLARWLPAGIAAWTGPALAAAPAVLAAHLLAR